LFALVLPAVQAAREGARKAQCMANLRQMAIALQSYHNNNDCYPVPITATAMRRAKARVTQGGYPSIHSRLLPYMDNTNIYNAINFDVDLMPVALSTGSENGTAIGNTVSAFVCPSDSGPFEDRGVNFRGNVGLGPAVLQSAEHPDSGNGFFCEIRVVRDAYIPDGLSHTVAFSERLRGSGGTARGVPDRDFWMVPGFVGTADDLLVGCQIAARAEKGPTWSSGGSTWFWSGRDSTLYTHTQAPDGAVPDCLHHPVYPVGMATVRSRHPGGVNAAMGDGSVRFFLRSTNQAVWRAFGTRNGGELVD
jgi:prepilin-type processing-associated H-X9-DG protein